MEKGQRYDFIDQFRGFIGVLMLLGHSSYYLNAFWKQLNEFDPLFPSWGQFALRYAGYICAPGFLMMAGGMTWLSFHKRLKKGAHPWKAKWHLIQRGIFLIIIQITWVNSSWGGFQTFNPWHLGIISTIGFSMILLSLIVSWQWYYRLALALGILAIHPLLLNISFNPDNLPAKYLMEAFITSGSFNKYPIIPWFALSVLGSVMGTGWFELWKTHHKRVIMGLCIGLTAIGLAIVIRVLQGYGNIFSYSGFGSYSFFIDQKYPPSLFHNIWFFGIVVLGVTLFSMIGRVCPKCLSGFSIIGKVPLFFYAIHLAILGIFVKRIDLFYREGSILITLLGFAIMMVIMIPLSKWFYGVKLRSNNYFISMI